MTTNQPNLPESDNTAKVVIAVDPCPDAAAQLAELKQLADGGAFEWPENVTDDEDECTGWVYTDEQGFRGGICDADALAIVTAAAEDALVKPEGVYLEIEIDGPNRLYTIWCDDRGLVVKGSSLADALRAELKRKQPNA